MGVMDKFLNYMKLNDEEDEGFYDDDYLDDEEEVEPVKKFSPAGKRCPPWVCPERTRSTSAAASFV